VEFLFPLAFPFPMTPLSKHFQNELNFGCAYTSHGRHIISLTSGSPITTLPLKLNLTLILTLT